MTGSLLELTHHGWYCPNVPNRQYSKIEGKLN